MHHNDGHLNSNNSDHIIRRHTMKVVLTIAGSDCSGGAGIQADLKTMCAHGVYGMSAITALTAQNTLGVKEIIKTPPEFLEKQIDMCLSDIPCDAVKIGMLSSASQVLCVSKALKSHSTPNIVLDPVMMSTSGTKLMEDDAIEALKTALFPMCKLITPNIPEAKELTRLKIEDPEDMKKACTTLYEAYGAPVLLKGGHLESWALDILFDGDSFFTYENEKLASRNTHGTGCTLSSAIASNLALGHELPESVKRAKSYITRAIETAPGLGSGNGPLNHCVSFVDP